MKISKRKIKLNLAIFIFLLYGFSIGLQNKLYVVPDITVPILFIISIVWIKKYKPYGRRIDISTVLALIMMLVMTLFNNANLKHHDRSQLIFSCAILIFYIYAKEYGEWAQMCIKQLVVIGLFYSGMTIYTMFDPTFFNKVVVPIFKDYGYMDEMIVKLKQGYITGFTPHYSTNAMYLTITLGAMLAIALSKKNKKYIVYSLITLGCIFFTGKRAHALFSIGALLIAYYYLNCDKKLERWFKILGLIITGICVYVILADYIPQLNNVVNRFIEGAADGDIESGRDVQRLLALTVWNKSKILGIGWDGFKYYYKSIHGILLNVHCVYIQLLCEVGIIGSIAFYLFFIISLTHTLYAVKRGISRKLFSQDQKMMVVFSIYIQIFFLLYCITGNPLYDAPTLFAYIMGCAMGENLYIKVMYN